MEFEAIKTVHDALAPLEAAARTRVLTYITSLLSIDVRSTNSKPAESADDGEVETEEDTVEEQATKGSPKFSSFAELYDAASPKTNSEKALVIGYWLQVCLASESFTAAAANKELTHLGHKVANITNAIDDLKKQKPALALQLKKSGTSQQARKTYKVSHAGVKRVEEMILG
jgi:hypothetical protein